jgi:predicted regulator of Ras-like GTPase activity (Roadblock/LC7/MglB family)
LTPESEFGNPSRTAAAALARDAARAACLVKLHGLVADTTTVLFASLSTVDGRTFAHASSNSQVEGPRIAAMSSSLLALSNSLAKEAMVGLCQYSAIAAEGGSIVLVRLPSPYQAFTLSVAGGSTESIGMILRNTLDLAQLLGEILDPSGLRPSSNN